MNKNLKKITGTLSFLVIVFLVAYISHVVGWGFDPGDPPGGPLLKRVSQKNQERSVLWPEKDARTHGQTRLGTAQAGRRG